MRSRLLQLGNSLALIAVCCYIGLSAAPVFMDGSSTAAVYQRTLRETCHISGVFLRSEYVLPRSEGLFPELSEGTRVPVGGALGGENSPVSGVFTANLDGYEHISAPLKLAPLEVLALTKDRRIAADSAGKIVTDAVWRFAALIETDRVKTLRVGESYELESDYWGGVKLTLRQIGESWEDFTAVMFEGNGDMDKILYLREVSAELIIAEHTGLNLPGTALFEDSEGYYVKTLTLGKERRAAVRPVYYGEGFVLVASGELWDGNEVLLKDIDLEAQK